MICIPFIRPEVIEACYHLVVIERGFAIGFTWQWNRLEKRFFGKEFDGCIGLGQAEIIEHRAEPVKVSMMPSNTS